MFRSKILLFNSVAVTTLLVFSYQNCTNSGVEFGEVPTQSIASRGEVSPATPVDPGRVEDPRNCVMGKRLGIWLDQDDDGLKDSNGYLGSVVAYEGDMTSKDNYDYYSYSAHPKIGPEPKGYASHVFFYEGSDGLTMNFYFNIDAAGSKDNKVEWEIDIADNDMADDVILSDDAGEIRVSERDKEASLTSYRARFRYYLNTDGGVIGPLQGDDYAIKVNVQEVGDITDATFYSANGKVFSLKDNNDNAASFIISFLEYENCQ